MKFIRNVTGILAAFLIVFCGIFSVNAFADEEEQQAKLTYKISYSNKYTYLELTPSNKKNTIRFTTDGSKPTKQSSKYKVRLRTTKSAVVRATEYTNTGKAVDTIKVTLKVRCKTPEIFVVKAKKDYRVALTCETENAKIHYTTDGSKPTVDSPVYVDPFTVEKGTVVRFYAGKSGYKNSKYVEETVNAANVEKEDFPETVVEISAEPRIEYDEQALQVLELINKEREDEGLAPLTMNFELCEAAQIRADEIVDYYHLGHTRPSGEKWNTVLVETGYNYATAGENTGRFEGVKADLNNVVSRWMGSKVHKANILNEWGDETGLAWAKKGNTTFWVQLFGAQK